MGVIYLARHGRHAEVGRVLSGRSPIALDAEGRAEAEALAERLGHEALASIHSSPRLRALETAEPLARRQGLEARIAPELDEVDFGLFSGRSFADLDGDADWRRWNAERDTFRCPGGATMVEASARALDFLRALPPEETPALCVSHCDIIRGVVASVLGLTFDRIFAFDCAPGSLTRIAFDGEQARLLSLNEHGWRRQV